jgi:hypothetical protein
MIIITITVTRLFTDFICEIIHNSSGLSCVKLISLKCEKKEKKEKKKAKESSLVYT